MDRHTFIVMNNIFWNDMCLHTALATISIHISVISWKLVLKYFPSINNGLLILLCGYPKHLEFRTGAKQF